MLHTRCWFDDEFLAYRRHRLAGTPIGVRSRYLTMCGIAGFWQPATPFSSLGERARTIVRMRDSLRHRGPDDGGDWMDAAAGVAFGHRRLSVIDLSAAAHQPILSQSNRYVLVYNGELYNFQELRLRLEGHGVRFRGHGDTEVLVEAIAEWGLIRALEGFDGMFAFALWDRTARQLHLVRDRFGEKPLYYSLVGNLLLFGSELKALLAHPQFSGTIDRASLCSLLRYSYIPAPHTIYTDARKVLPGTVVTISADEHQRLRASVTRYWSLSAHVLELRTRTPQRCAPERLTAALRASVQSRMVSDVPFGAFLSGGVDSSTVVALMQQAGPRRTRTFTIGFEDARYDESQHAEAIAAHLGTEHTTLTVTARTTLDAISSVATLYDEPFADSSQIPTAILCALTRRSVTVALSGDGGDELFGGYQRYRLATRGWRVMSHVPIELHRAIGRMADDAPSAGRSGQLLAKAASYAGADSFGRFYLQFLSAWKSPADVVLGGVERKSDVVRSLDEVSHLPLGDRLLAADSVTYFPDDILVKVDRAAMAVGLETRLPLLDPKVVDLAWSIRRGTLGVKQPLRDVLARYVPPRLFERPKMGFGLPIEKWLRGPLKGWAGDLLAGGLLERQGFFDPRPIIDAWHHHLTGHANYRDKLWPVLMFQAWYAHIHGSA
jgi:asparagine synthase (glutamine-hydrolysing)